MDVHFLIFSLFTSLLLLCISFSLCVSLSLCFFILSPLFSNYLHLILMERCDGETLKYTYYHDAEVLDFGMNSFESDLQKLSFCK